MSETKRGSRPRWSPLGCGQAPVRSGFEIIQHHVQTFLFQLSAAFMTCEKRRSVFTSLFVIKHGTIIYVLRNCIGQAFALPEIKTAIAMILRM